MPQNLDLQDEATPAALELSADNSSVNKLSVDTCAKPAYRERLNYWAIARLLPDLEPHIVARFRNRSDADGHLNSLRQRMPSGQFVVLFNPQQSVDRL